ncbi:hypothetical protein ACJX0J_035037 [Zea mays]
MKYLKMMIFWVHKNYCFVFALFKLFLFGKNWNIDKRIGVLILGFCEIFYYVIKGLTAKYFFAVVTSLFTRPLNFTSLEGMIYYINIYILSENYIFFRTDVINYIMHQHHQNNTR